MQDMLRLTQQNIGVASTRHSNKPVSGSLLTGAVGMGTPSNNALNATSEDFLKKIKMQQDHDKQRSNNTSGANPGVPQTKQKSFTVLH